MFLGDDSDEYSCQQRHTCGHSGGTAGVNAARRMAEFCYMIKRPLNVFAFVYPPDAGKTNEILYGTDLVMIPVYKTVAEATASHPQINTSLVYIGADRAYAASMEALNDPHIKMVSMITEGVPEKDAKLLGAACPQAGEDIQWALFNRDYFGRRMPPRRDRRCVR